MLHSLCLAPGEVTKVAVIDWKRREAGTDASSTRQDERASATGEQNLGTSEVQRAQARERQTGRSSTSSVAAQSQTGGNVGFLFGGASASSSLSTSLGHSASISTGSRQLAAESSREISQRTQQEGGDRGPGAVERLEAAAGDAGERDRDHRGEIEALKADRKNKEIAQHVSSKDLVQLLQRDRLVREAGDSTSSGSGIRLAPPVPAGVGRACA